MCKINLQKVKCRHVGHRRTCLESFLLVILPIKRTLDGGVQKICLERTNKLVFDGGAWLVDSRAVTEILVQQRPHREHIYSSALFYKPRNRCSG